MEVQKGIHGIPQSGILSHDLLVWRLAQHGYAPCPTTTGLWKPQIKDIAITVDDFGIKYIGKDNAHDLINALQSLRGSALNATPISGI